MLEKDQDVERKESNVLVVHNIFKEAQLHNSLLTTDAP